MQRGRLTPKSGEGEVVGVAAIILAAGRSRRMGANKLLAELDGLSMLGRVVSAVAASDAAPILVVTGHERDLVRQALLGWRTLVLVDNPHFTRGLASSLACGIVALPQRARGALICLADMPEVTTDDINRLVTAFEEREGESICVPCHGGRRGNPVLLPREFFPEVVALRGDVGARALIEKHHDRVLEVTVGNAGVLRDIDTPESLAAWSGDAHLPTAAEPVKPNGCTTLPRRDVRRPPDTAEKD